MLHSRRHSPTTTPVLVYSGFILFPYSITIPAIDSLILMVTRIEVKRITSFVLLWRRRRWIHVNRSRSGRFTFFSVTSECMMTICLPQLFLARSWITVVWSANECCFSSTSFLVTTPALDQLLMHSKLSLERFSSFDIIWCDQSVRDWLLF